MSKHLNELISLAKNDQEIDSYRPKLEAADNKVARVQKKINASQEQCESIEAEINDNSSKIKIFEEQLVTLNEQLALGAQKAKEISTEKEMKALSLEEDIAKEKMTFANEEIERLQEVNGTKQTLLEEEKEIFNELQAKFNEVNEETSKVKADIEKAQSSLFTAREKIARTIDGKMVAFYEKIRKWAGNTAVVPVKKQACYGCYIKLNDKTYAEVIKANEICNCPHCGRILYIETVTGEE